MNSFLLLIGLLEVEGVPKADTAALVRQLGATKFKDRHAAQAALGKCGWESHSCLKAGAVSDDPEIRRRCNELLAGLIERQVASMEPLPWIDGAWYEPGLGYSSTTEIGGVQFYRLLGPYFHARGYRPPADDDPWPSYRDATRAFAVDALREGCPPWLLRTLFAEMRARDAAFFKRYNVR